jgi:hypothetical protein
MFLQYRNKSKSQLTSPTPAQLPAVVLSAGHISYIRNCWTEMLARSLGHIIILVHFRSNVRYNFIQHCFWDLRSHFEALESVFLIFFLGFTSKKYDQTDSRAPKCLLRITKTVMYIVKFNTVFVTSGVILWPSSQFY